LTELSKESLEKLDRISEISVATFSLDFPCNDSSENVTDFGDWSHFKKPSKCGHVKNTTHTSGWSDATLERINNHVYYDVENLALSNAGKKAREIREEKKLQQRRAKAQLMRWNSIKQPQPRGHSPSGRLLSAKATKGAASTISAAPSIVSSFGPSKSEEGALDTANNAKFEIQLPALESVSEDD
jgi:hypothetical protein